MKLGHLFLAICFTQFSQICTAQINNDLIKQQLESMQENNSDTEISDDSYLQDLDKYNRHPINLNTATFSQLTSLRILSALQISNFFSYRKLLGNFINILELQSIPDWNTFTIQQILPYVFVAEEKQKGLNFSKLFLRPEQKILIRYTRVLQRSNGYLPGSNNTDSKYLGSPAKILLRYTASFHNVLQYGITASKDAGEQFFKGSQKSGFDFYSPHIFIKNYGNIKSLALGDFTVNMGQGLIQWQGFSIGKTPQVINIEKQSEILNPYRSTGQLNFHRGIGITVSKKHLTKTLFISQRKLDATFKNDSLGNDFISSLQTSGYHRSLIEIKNSNRQKQFTIGANITYVRNQFLLAINNINYFLGTPVRKSTALYNKYSFSGKNLSNTSINYSVTFQGIHSFGEIAIDNDYSAGFITGVMMALDKKIDLSFLYRNISRSFNSFYSNAFTEGSSPTNEKGIYVGLSFNPVKDFNLNGYVDLYNFPWIKYRINSPSKGSDYLMQAALSIKKSIRFGFKSRYHIKPQNFNPQLLQISPVAQIPNLYCKSYLDYKPYNSSITYQLSFTINSHRPFQGSIETGRLLNIQFSYSTPNKKLDVNWGSTIFSIPGSNSRIYLYESDILFNTTIPSFVGQGFRLFTNFSYTLNNGCQLFLKFSNFHIKNSFIGSGADQILGNNKSEIKAQILSNF